MMIKRNLISLAVCLCLAACSGSDSKKTESSAQKPQPQPASSLEAAFPKHTQVFGIAIRATNQVPDDKIKHAANIMAEYLDNNDDGLVDNEQVVEQLVARKATLIMARDESEIEALQSSIGSDVEMDSLQDLYASETIPNGAQQGQFDASLEEVLHLITHVGYANVYPEVFGEKIDSLIADAMDKARGGRFTTIPAQYPSGAWYTYDDETCDYSCMVTEYTYWALTSILGAQAFDGRLAQIEQEWKLNTEEKVRLGDLDAFHILTNQAYLLPSTLPDGQYQSTSFEIATSATTSTTPAPTANNVIGAASEQACKQASEQDRQACFIVQDDKALMYGVIGESIVSSVTQLTSAHPDVDTIVLIDVPGSMDDDSNLKAATMVYDSGLNTQVLAHSDIASGGVDFYLAGNQRLLAEGAKLGVHSWGGEDGQNGSDLPRSHSAHQVYIDFYQHIKMDAPADFYFFTLDAASADDIHYMTADELTQWKIAR